MTNTVSKFFILFGVSLLSLTSFAKDAVKEPVKVIAKTPYCSNMKLIDQAHHVSLSQVKEADYILISKQRRLLYLLNQGQIVRVYSVAFGNGSLKGPKAQLGDGRTPEGLYFIDGKNDKSKYHLGLHLSYPTQADIDFAKTNLNAAPGGDIMIHGFPGGFIDGLNPEIVKKTHPKADWTQGCIAVTDTEIEEIFSVVKTKVPVEICPLGK